MISAIPAMIPMPIAATIPRSASKERKKSLKPPNISGKYGTKKIKTINPIPKNNDPIIISIIKPSPKNFFISALKQIVFIFS